MLDLYIFGIVKIRKLSSVPLLGGIIEILRLFIFY